MMTPFEKMILLPIPADYGWDDVGIVKIGAGGDIAALAKGDFNGKCLIFCHGNGETAVSERHWFERLNAAGVSVICPDYRGYGRTEGELSETGCYEAAHAAYNWLVNEQRVTPERIAVLGYSLGSAIAVELATSVELSALILQAPFLSGAALRPVWEKRRGISPSSETDTSFPTESRLSSIRIPTLVIHGTDDEIIPYEQGHAVYSKIASTDKRFVPVAKAGHCTFQSILGEKYISLLKDFLLSGNSPRIDSKSSLMARLSRYLSGKCCRMIGVS